MLFTRRGKKGKNEKKSKGEREKEKESLSLEKVKEGVVYKRTHT